MCDSHPAPLNSVRPSEAVWQSFFSSSCFFPPSLISCSLRGQEKKRRESVLNIKQANCEGSLLPPSFRPQAIFSPPSSLSSESPSSSLAPSPSGALPPTCAPSTSRLSRFTSLAKKKTKKTQAVRSCSKLGPTQSTCTRNKAWPRLSSSGKGGVGGRRANIIHLSLTVCYVHGSCSLCCCCPPSSALFCSPFP